MEDLQSGVAEDPYLCKLALVRLRSVVFSIQMLVECVGLVIALLNTGTVIFIYCAYVRSNYVRKSEEKISQCLLGIRRM
jgi:hypothetical protein